MSPMQTKGRGFNHHRSADCCARNALRTQSTSCSSATLARADEASDAQQRECAGGGNNSKGASAGGGGAILIRDRELARSMQAAAGLLMGIDRSTREEEARFRAAYYTIRGQAQHNESERIGISKLSLPFSGLLLRGTHEPDWERVGKGLVVLDSSVAERRERALLFAKELSHVGVTIPQGSPGSSPWRFSFLMNDTTLTRPLTSQLRDAVGHVSNWYPSLAQDYGVDRELTPNSYLVEQSIVNLWVDCAADDEYISRALETVCAFC